MVSNAKSPFRKARWSPVTALLTAAVLVIGLAGVSTMSLSALNTAIPTSMFTVLDQQGANDQPGQVDLTQMGRDERTDAGFYDLFWSWDSIDSWTGTGQTGDACSLFDYNGNGKIDAVVCGQVHNTNADPTKVSQAHAPYVFRCDDSKNDRCSNPSAAQSYGTSDIKAGELGSPVATASGTAGSQADLVTATDPFGPSAVNGPGSNYSKDATLQVNISKSYLLGLAAKLGPKWPAISSPTPTLVNVCSYPSAGSGGNNNPFDCITAPGSGFLVIHKNAGTASRTFSFTLDPVPTGATTTATVSTTNGSGDSASIGLITTSNESVTETVPSGWTLTAKSCLLEDGVTTANTGTSTNGVTGVTIESGRVTTCTFTNTNPVVPGIATNTSGATGTFATLNTISVPVGATVTDTIQVATASGRPTPTGSVAFRLYFTPGPAPSVATACTGTPVFTDTQTLSGGTATSNGYATSASKIGHYYWQNVYTPDTAGAVNYTSATETCGEEVVTAVDARVRITPHEAYNQVGQDHVLTATVEWTDPANSSTWTSAGAPGTWSLLGGALVSFSLNSGTSATFKSSVSSCTTAATGPGSGSDAGTCQVTIQDSTAETVGIHAASTFNVTGVSGAFSRSTSGAGGCTSAVCDAIKHYFNATTTLAVSDDLVGLPAVAGGTVAYTSYPTAADCTAKTNGTSATPASATVVAGDAPSSTSVSVPAGSAVWFRAAYSGDAAHNVNAFTTGCTERAASD